MKRPMDIAYQFMKDNILNGIYKPSQKLNESDLSHEIGVSRNTVKKALLKLQQEQLVEVIENKGANVKSYTLEEVINYLEIRELLEGLVAKRAVKNISDTQLTRLEEIIAQMESNLKNKKYDEYSSLNKEFHQIIYHASENKQAVEMINVIKTQLSRYHIRTILIPGRNEESFKEHHHIFLALKNRNEILVEKEIKIHISNIRKTIQDNYSVLL